jgi:hypothetical protein
MTRVVPELDCRRAWVDDRRVRAGVAAGELVPAATRWSAACMSRRWMIASISGRVHRKPALGSPWRNAVRFAASPASRPRARRARYVAFRLAVIG